MDCFPLAEMLDESKGKQIPNRAKHIDIAHSQALQRADKLCPGHRKGIWYPRVVQRSQCSTLRIYTKVSGEVSIVGETEYEEDIVTSVAKVVRFN